MQQVVDTLNIVMPLFYLAVFGSFLFNFIKDHRRAHNLNRLFLFLALMLHTTYIILRTIAFDHPPITNVFEIFTLLSFAIALAYFILELATDIKGTGVFILSLSLIFQLISSIFIVDLLEVKDVLRSNLLGIHVFSALLGYAGITISAVYGFLYLLLYDDIKKSKYGLIFERLPNLEILEKLSFYSAIFGFLTLTIAMAIGIIWLPQAFPDFSFTDAKLIATAVIWLLYGAGIGFKISGKWQGKKVVVLSIAGFLIAIASTIITNFIARSFHAFY